MVSEQLQPTRLEENNNNVISVRIMLLQRLLHCNKLIYTTFRMVRYNRDIIDDFEIYFYYLRSNSSTD